AVEAAEAVVVAEAISDSGGSPPTDGRATARGHHDPADDSGQTPLEPAMQRESQDGRPRGPLRGQSDDEHPRPSRCNCVRSQPQAWQRRGYLKWVLPGQPSVFGKVRFSDQKD